MSKSLLTDFAARLRAVEDRQVRDVIRRRAGWNSPPETHLAISKDHGVSREWIRRLEVRGTERIFGRGWGDLVRRRVRRAWTGDVHPLHELATSGWFSQVVTDRGRHVLRFVVGHLFSDGVPAVVELDGSWCLSPAPARALEKAAKAVREKLDVLDYPATEDRVRAVVEACSPDLAWTPSLLARAKGELVWEAQDGARGAARALGLAHDSRHALLAALRDAPAPVSKAELLETLGYLRPNVAFDFGEGTLGLPQHLQSFETWQRLVAPLCLEVMRTEPSREWSADELLTRFTRSKKVLWGLVMVLRQTEELRYLGRRRFAVRDSGITHRTFLRHIVEEVVRTHGPVTLDELMTRLPTRVDAPRKNVRQVLTGAQFVRHGDRWSVRVERSG